MSKKTLLSIISIFLLLMVLGGVFLITHNSNSSKDKEPVDNKKEEKVGPALTGKKDKQDKAKEEQERKEKKEHEKKEDKNKENKSKKETSSKSDKDQEKELTKNTEFLLKKTIKGTENSDEEQRVKDIATEKMINQVDGADDNNTSKDVDIRNTSIDFKDTHHFIAKTLNGTFKYDLLMKDNDSDAKNSSTTHLDQTSSVKFVKEDGKYKLDKLSK